MKFIDLRYFFLYPTGHLGETEVTFLAKFPFTQTMLLTAALAAAWVGVGVGVGVGLGVGFTSEIEDPVRTTRIVGLE
jgi:hypothetical protein